MSPDTPDTSSRLGPSLCFQIQNERLLVRAFADTALCFNYLLVSRVAVPEDRYKQAVRERVQRKRAFLKSRGGIDLGNVARGMYLLEVRGPSIQHLERIVVQ